MTSNIKLGQTSNQEDFVSLYNCKWEEKDNDNWGIYFCPIRFCKKFCMQLMQQSMHFTARCMAVIKYMNSIASYSELSIYHL